MSAQDSLALFNPVSISGERAAVTPPTAVGAIAWPNSHHLKCKQMAGQIHVRVDEIKVYDSNVNSDQ